MVSLVSKLLVISSAVFGAAQALATGEYFRPTGDDVSGRVGATTAYVRSPCPAINTLANHGYLPRDGKSITHDQLRTALQDVYNAGDSLISLFLSRLPETVALSDLSKHNFIEHDASLVHGDASAGGDPSAINHELWKNVVSHAKNGQLGARDIASVRRDRLAQCHAQPTGCEFGAKQRILALGEAALLLRCLGGGNVESISLHFAESFLVKERIPTEYTKPPTPVSLAGALITAGNIQLLSLYQDIAAMIFA